MNLEDLSKEALDDYKMLLDSGRFAQSQLDFYVEHITDQPPHFVGLSQGNVVKMLAKSPSTIPAWRKSKVLSATKFGSHGWLYDAHNIIKASKIARVRKNGEIVWV